MIRARADQHGDIGTPRAMRMRLPIRGATSLAVYTATRKKVLTRQKRGSAGRIAVGQI